MLSLYNLYDFSAVIKRSTEEKVWLKSGGMLIIQQTEAFACIDVNSAKSGKWRKDEGGVLDFNMKAAEEAFRQIRLRQLSGIILIDFINMKSKQEKDRLIEYCSHLAGKDPVYTNVIDITQLGIMQITRKKTHKNISQFNHMLII